MTPEEKTKEIRKAMRKCVNDMSWHKLTECCHDFEIVNGRGNREFWRISVKRLTEAKYNRGHIRN